MYWMYLGLFAVFLVIEAVSFNLITIWMAVSALLTSIYAYFFPTQILPQAFIFIVLSIVFIALTKPLSKKLTKKAKTNTDTLIGEIGVVTVGISNLKGEGQIKIKNQTWSAKSADGGEIPSDTKVLIEGIEGVKLIVKTI